MPLPFGEETELLSIARYGGRLVYESEFKDTNLWRAPGPNAVNFSGPESLLASTADELFPAYSPDSSKIAFISGRSGGWEVWVADVDGSNIRQLTNWGFAAHPRWSPDGQQISFSSGRYAIGSGNQEYATVGYNADEAFVVDASGGFPQMISEGGRGAKAPSWSADGRSIYFESGFDECGGAQIWKRNIDTGEEMLLARCGFRPLEGVDGRVYFFDVEGQGISSVPVEGGEIRLELSHGGECRRFFNAWTLWERNLVYLDCQDLAIKMLDLGTRETRVLADVYTDKQISEYLSLDVSPDGQWLIYSRFDGGGSDLMLVEPFE